MSSRRLLILALTIATILGIPTLGAAQEGDDNVERAPGSGTLPDFFHGLRAGGAGNSHTAVASGVDAVYQNPAGVARAPMYVLDGTFSHSPQGALLSAGIADSKLNPQFAMGVAYNYFIGRDELENISGHDARLALAIPVVPEQISIGAGVRYLRIKDDRLPMEDDEDPQLMMHGVTFDAGINFRVAELLHLGLVGQNLIDLCSGDEVCQGSTPTRVGGGLGVGSETSFMISADAAADLTSGPSPTFDFGVGGEYLVAHAVPLRIGFERRGHLDRNLLTAGGGWRSEQAGVDISYQHDLNDANRFGYISGGFSVYF